MKMKFKMFIAMFVAMFAISMVSCDRHKKQAVEPEAATEEVVENQALVVENVISMDRQDMFLNYQNDYRWYETCIVLEDYLDAEGSEGKVHAVSNIFQYVVEKDEHSADVRVVMYTHLPDTTAVEVVNSFWIGDCVMNEAEIKLTFEQAYDRLMQANLPKPHSKQVVLRKELGPKDANPQYIFGNVQSHVYVDAVTGDVSTTNPVYGEEFQLAKPLGEWP